MKIVIIGFWTYPKNAPRAFRTWNLAECFAEKGHDVTLYAYTGGKNYDNETKGLFKIKNLGDCTPWCDDSISKKKMPLYMRVINKLVKEINVYPYKKCYPHIKLALQQEGEIDLLISVAHPHAVHWAVEKYIDKQKVKKWVADCGDPFMGDPFNKHMKSLEKVERDWCGKVDYITIPVKGGVSAYYPEFREKIRIIPQGFKINDVEIANYQKNDIPTFGFAGGVYPKLRDPRKLLEYIKENNLNVKFVVYSSSEIFAEFKDILQEKMEIRKLVDRDTLIKELSKLDFLINIKNVSAVQAPSKLIDYTLTQRPILDISTDLTEEEKINLLKFMGGDYSSKHEDIDITQFAIENVCDAFLELAK